MASTILFKRSTTGEPSTDDLEYGELAVNYTDSKFYIKNLSNEIIQVMAGNTENVNVIQGGYIHSTRDDTDGAGEDASYLDVSLSSPYVSVDDSKSVVMFEGGFFDQTTGEYGDQFYFADVTSRFLNGSTIRLSSIYDSGSYYFIGRWLVIETS